MPQVDTNLCDPALSQLILSWYDHNARTLPWRIGPHDRARAIWPNPYFVWLSEIMLQQTTVAAVRDYFIKFTTIWPSVFDLASAADEDVMAAWAGLGYYARARNLLATARIVAQEHEGKFPKTTSELQTLPGVGSYTAAAIAAIAYNEPATVVDGNVERVMARLFDIHTPLPDAKPELTAKAAQLTPNQRPGDYAQAVMDLGATICTPKKPACGLCPVRAACASWHQGTHEALPKKTRKEKKPTRHGIAYVAKRVDGAILLEERPKTGLLGGMIAFPTSGWDGHSPEEEPIRAEWRELGEEVRHTFTHFHLKLRIKTALVPMDRPVARGSFIHPQEFNSKALPTLMRKVNSIASHPV